MPIDTNERALLELEALLDVMKEKDGRSAAQMTDDERSNRA